MEKSIPLQSIRSPREHKTLDKEPLKLDQGRNNVSKYSTTFTRNECLSGLRVSNTFGSVGLSDKRKEKDENSRFKASASKVAHGGPLRVGKKKRGVTNFNGKKEMDCLPFKKRWDYELRVG